MSYQATVYRIFIASPSDVVEEREVIPKVIHSWNAANSLYHKVMLEPVKWETHATPEMGDRPQAILNKQLVEKCDILIGVFRTRLGTPTGEAESGTLEEIEEFRKVGRPRMLYFWSVPLESKDIDKDQYDKLLEFKAQIKGLVYSYKTIDELKERLQNHLMQTIYDVHKLPIKISKEAEDGERKTLHSVQRPSLKVAAKSLPTSIHELLATMTVKPRVYDEKIQPPIGSTYFPSYKWDARNFEGFWYVPKTESTSEILEIGGLLGNPLTITLDHNRRTIPENTLVYLTVRQAKTLKIVEKGITPIELLNSFPNGQYYILGWQAQPYIAVKAKANKLSKVIIEQGTDDIKTLKVGETWDMGDGYTLMPQSIDSRAIPRQVWFVLSKEGIKLDDKVIAQGEAYVYTPNIAGETAVPIFVTYVESVFTGATSDAVQLKYTWLTSSTVTEIKAGDQFAVMEVNTANHEYLILKNKKPIPLSKGSTIDIMGNLKFIVVDDPNFLRFHPIVLR